MQKRATLDAYIRVSDVAGRNGERYISPNEQRRTIEGAAERLGVNLGEVIIEENVSGSKAADKRRLGELLERCEQGESSGIIVSNVDRLTRASKLEEAKIMDRLNQAGARLVVVNEGIDTEAPGSELTLDIMAALARAQWRRYQANWKQARARAVERGAFPSQTPFGYARDQEGRLIAEPERAKIVRKMFRRRADGATIADLGRWLASELVPSPAGGKAWSHSTIAQILRNRVYLGDEKHGELTKTAAHPPLVSRIEFDAAQIAKPLRVIEPKAHSAGALLAGIARCAACGHTLKIVTGYGGKLRYYCKGPYTTGACSGRCLIRVDELDPWVEEWFLGEIKDRVRVAGLVQAQDRVEETQKAVDLAERELAAFVNLTSALDEALFRSGLEDRQRTLEIAQGEHAQALSEVKVYGSVPDGDALAAWPTLATHLKRRLLATVFDKVLVVKGNGNVAKRVRFERDGIAIPHA